MRPCHTDGAKINMTSPSVCRSTKSQTASTFALTDILSARRDISGLADYIYIYIYLCVCVCVYTYLLTYSMVQSPSWEANWFGLVKKFPAFHGTRRFITALTIVRHLSQSWTSRIQSIYPHTTSWRSVLILSTHLCLGLLSGLLPSGFTNKTLYTLFSSPYVWSRGWVEVWLYSSMTAALEGVEWSAACPGCSLPPAKNPVPILQEAIYYNIGKASWPETLKMKRFSFHKTNSVLKQHAFPSYVLIKHAIKMSATPPPPTLL